MAPGNPDVRVALADLLISAGAAWPMHCPSTALSWSWSPDSPEALQGLGLALYATGRGAEAIDDLREGGRDSPGGSRCRG